MGREITKLDSNQKLSSTANEVLKKSKVSLEAELGRVREENAKMKTELEAKEATWARTELEIERFKQRLSAWKEEKVPLLLRGFKNIFQHWML